MNNSFDDLFKQINQSAERIYTQFNGIPKMSKEVETHPNLKYKTKFFFIAEQTGADEYADFMTTLINNPKKYSLIRERENWTPSGELIKLIEYLEKTKED